MAYTAADMQAVTRERDKVRRVLRALDTFLNFNNPDQVYVFQPSEYADVEKLWRRAAAASK